MAAFQTTVIWIVGQQTDHRVLYLTEVNHQVITGKVVTGNSNCFRIYVIVLCVAGQKLSSMCFALLLDSDFYSLKIIYFPSLIQFLKSQSKNLRHYYTFTVVALQPMVPQLLIHLTGLLLLFTEKW